MQGAGCGIRAPGNYMRNLPPTISTPSPHIGNPSRRSFGTFPGTGQRAKTSFATPPHTREPTHRARRQPLIPVNAPATLSERPPIPRPQLKNLRTPLLISADGGQFVRTKFSASQTERGWRITHFPEGKAIAVAATR